MNHITFILFILGVKSAISTDSFTSIDTIAKIIGNISESDDNPSILISFDCWTKMERINFSTSMEIPTHMLNIGLRNISQHFTHNAHSIRVFLDMRCTGSDDFLHQFEEFYFGRPYRWILFGPDKDHLMDYDFLPDSEVIAVNFNEEMQLYDLKYGNCD